MWSFKRVSAEGANIISVSVNWRLMTRTFLRFMQFESLYADKYKEHYVQYLVGQILGRFSKKFSMFCRVPTVMVDESLLYQEQDLSSFIILFTVMRVIFFPLAVPPLFCLFHWLWIINLHARWRWTTPRHDLFNSLWLFFNFFKFLYFPVQTEP